MTVYIAAFALLPFVLFFGLYSRLRWWKTDGGRSTWVLSLACVLVLGLTFLRYLGWLPPLAIREVVYTVIGVAGWFQLYSYVRNERTAPHSRRITDSMEVTH